MSTTRSVNKSRYWVFKFFNQYSELAEEAGGEAEAEVEEVARTPSVGVGESYEGGAGERAAASSARESDPRRRSQGWGRPHPVGGRSSSASS
jgi:hypothetical protein